MKQYHRYQMDFDEKWVRLSAICMGLSMFLLAVYYLGLCYLGDTGAGTKILSLWLPLMVGMAYILLICVIRWNAPGIYAILGTALCALLLLGAFADGGVLRIVLSLAGYVLGAALLILTAGGYVPGRLPAALCFAALLVVRLLCFDLGSVSGKAWIAELGELGILASLMFLPLGMTEIKKQ